MRFGQNMAAATGKGLWDISGLLGDMGQRQAQAENQRQKTLIDELAERRMKAEKDAEAAQKVKDDEGFAQFQAHVAENPGMSPAERADAALKFGVTGDDRAKNYLGANLGGSRFGESQAENTRKEGRFGEQMKAKEAGVAQAIAAANRNYELAVARMKQAKDQKEKDRAQDEAHFWASLGQKKREFQLRASSTSDALINTQDEADAALEEIDNINSQLGELDFTPGLTDPATKAQMDNLYKRHDYLWKGVKRYEFGDEGSARTVEMSGSSSNTPNGIATPTPVAAPVKPVAERRPPVAKPNVPSAVPPAGAQIRTATNGKRYYILNNKRIYID